MKNVRFPKFKGVIFDMDGVVIDSEPSFKFAWKQAAKAFGIQLQDEMVRKLLGQQAEDVERALKRAIGSQFDFVHFRHVAAQSWREYAEKRGIPPMPGLANVLELLDQAVIPYGLATNSNGPIAAECLLRSRLDKRFSLIVTREQVAAAKPEPDLFIHAAKCMGISVNECLIFEDSAIGLMAAKRAGAIPVLVNADPSEESQKLAAFSFHTLNEVAATLKRSLN